MEFKNQPIIKIGDKNLNHRIYTSEQVNKIVDSFNKKISKHHGVIGQFNHPDRFTTNLKDSTHEVTSLKIKNNVLYGDVRVLETELATKMKISEMIQDGILVLAPRCSGTINEDCTVSIEEFFAFDLIRKEESSFKKILF